MPVHDPSPEYISYYIIIILCYVSIHVPPQRAVSVGFSQGSAVVMVVGITHFENI